MGSFLKNIHPLLKRNKSDSSDTNYAILHAIDSVLNDVEKETIESKKHSALHSATGEYLNYFGGWFGVRRKDGESDSRYRRRIVQYLDMPRGTNQSVILAVRRYLEDPYVGVEIYEPYEDIFMLNKSKLNGTHGLMGDYYRFAVIQISIGSPFDEDLIDYVYRFTPSGVRVHINYDPSLPRRNDTSGTISAPLFAMSPVTSATEATRQTGLENYVGGRIQLRDQDSVLESFINNHSKMDDLDALTGSFTHGRELYHILGKGAEIVPKTAVRMGELLSQLEELPEEDYLTPTRQSGGAETAKVSLTPSEQVYMVWNIDKYLHTKYTGSSTKISRTREGYGDILEGSAFTLTTKSQSRGSSFDFEIYNFTTRRWETLKREMTNGSLNTLHATLTNTTNYLSQNRLMITRIKPNHNFELELDYLALDYKKELEMAIPLGLPIGVAEVGKTLIVQ